MEISGTHRARRVGELAASAGLTVRTLHYYEDIGLLLPSQRTPSGHRLYGEQDIKRLYRIVLLRQLGLPLAEIGRALDDREWETRAAMRRHLQQVDDRIGALSDIRTRLSRLLSTENASTTEDIVELMEEMTMLDTPLQRRISYLVYSDLEAAFEYLQRVFMLGPGQLTRNKEGDAIHAEVQAGDGVIWRHPESPDFGLASPETAGVVTAGTAVMVDDVDAHFRHASAEGATIVYQPVDQPYGYREYSARDLEGGLWSS